MTSDIIAKGLSGLGICFPSRAPEQLSMYYDMLTDWNERMNLTASMDESEALDKLFMDSAAPLASGLFSENARLIDVGSGAGFPGLVIAILRPDIRVTLLDSLVKRIGFLSAVIEKLGIGNAFPMHARAEDAARGELRESCDIATARAVAALPTLFELLLPFIKVGGRAICYKGPQAASELEQGAYASSILGGGEPQSIPVTIPSRPDWQHCVVVCDKLSKTDRQYPRQAGTPAKKPLSPPAAKR